MHFTCCVRPDPVRAADASGSLDGVKSRIQMVRVTRLSTIVLNVDGHSARLKEAASLLGPDLMYMSRYDRRTGINKSDCGKNLFRAWL